MAVLRRLLFYTFTFIKGLCIGVSGLLQGISGGSMALLLGVHRDFVMAIGSVDRPSFRKKKFASWWKRIDGTFIVVIVAGIVAGLLGLRAIADHYLNQYPIFIFSFFFSLVIVSALLLLRKVTRWNTGVVIALLTGLAISYLLTRVAPFSTPDHAGVAFVAGSLSGATFVFPGVSGVFILMFVGKYQDILTSFGSLEIDVIIPFIAGAVLGVTIAARLAAAALSRHYNLTVALFAGLMIGALNKIWPWREVLEYATTTDGKRVPAFDSSILPWRYLEITGKDPQVFYAILMMALGVFIVVLIEKIAARLKTKS